MWLENDDYFGSGKLRALLKVSLYCSFVCGGNDVKLKAFIFLCVLKNLTGINASAELCCLNGQLINESVMIRKVSV